MSVRLAIALLMLSALTASAIAQDAGPGTVTGVVRSHTGVDLDRAAVRLTGTGSNPYDRRRMASASGWFRFRGVPAGEYLVRVTRSSCRTTDTTLTVVAGETLEFDVSLWCAEFDAEDYFYFTPPSPEVGSVLESANRVRSYAVASGQELGESRPELGKIGSWWITSQGKDLSRRAGRKAADLLLSEESYAFGKERGKLCLFVPHHALRFESEHGTADVLVCFSCEQLMFVDGGNGDFDPSAPKLAEFFLDAGIPVEGHGKEAGEK